MYCMDMNWIWLKAILSYVLIKSIHLKNSTTIMLNWCVFFSQLYTLIRYSVHIDIETTYNHTLKLAFNKPLSNL